MCELDIFIRGEKVDLVIPTKEFAYHSDWYSWFNNAKTTRYIHHGIYPNTREKQLQFFENESSKRLLLMVSDRKNIIGTITLSKMDFDKRDAEIAVVFREDRSPKTAPLAALESFALLLEHAFSSLPLERIWAPQHIDLHKWSARLALLGFRAEGIKKAAFVKGNQRADEILIAVHQDDFMKIKEARGGTLWDGEAKMLQRIRALPAKSNVARLQEAFKQLEEYYRNIWEVLPTSAGGGARN